MNDVLEAARRIVAWDDSGRLADDEWLVERNETAIIAICRALLSASSAVRGMREALNRQIEAHRILCVAAGLDLQAHADGTAQARAALADAGDDAVIAWNYDMSAVPIDGSHFIVLCTRMDQAPIAWQPYEVPRELERAAIEKATKP